jgi:hypothetical protein
VVFIHSCIFVRVIFVRVIVGFIHSCIFDRDIVHSCELQGRSRGEIRNIRVFVGSCAGRGSIVGGRVQIAVDVKGVIVGGQGVVRAVVVIRIEGIEVIIVAAGEAETTVSLRTTGECLNAVFDLGWHGELSPVGPVKALSGHEAVKIVASLLVPSWTECEGTDGAGSHGVVMFFVGLHVLAESDAAVFGVVDDKADNNGARTESCGNTEPVREGIQLENT